MPTELEVAFDSVVNALEDAGMSIDDCGDYIIMTIDGRDYRIDIKRED